MSAPLRPPPPPPQEECGVTCLPHHPESTTAGATRHRSSIHHVLRAASTCGLRLRWLLAGQRRLGEGALDPVRVESLLEPAAPLAHHVPLAGGPGGPPGAGAA